MSTALAEWLEGFGLRGCYGALAAQNVDLDVLPDLTEQDLAQLGFSLGERKRLLRAVATLAPAQPARPAGQTAERRRLTVMFADLAGSTDLAARLDPEDFHTVVSAHLGAVSAAILRFGGFIARYQGDGVLAYFGWPQASDNDAQRAASAALAILADAAALEVTQRMQVRIGMATGLVVVGDIIGEGAAREVVVSGETANLAARLQSVAAPGSALIAAETKALLGPAFALGPPQLLTLKGFTAPVQAWTLLGEHHATAAGREGATRVLARDVELAWLSAQWAAVQDGAGRILLLSGEPGIGKSRVAEGFAAGISGKHTTLVIRAVQRHANTSLYPVAALVRGLAGLRAGESDADSRAKLDTLLAPLTSLGDARARRSRATLLAALLDLPVDERALDRDPRARKAALLETLAAIVVGRASTGPLLLVVEDIHWADATTLEWLGLVAAELATMPSLILLLSRPEFAPSWDGLSIATRALGPLPQEASAALVTQVAGSPLPAEVTAEILRRGDGVPLFIEEVTRAVLESGCLARAEDGWHLVRPIAAIDIPATLHDSLIARIDRLGWVKELCQTGAVIGRDFQPDLLAALSRQEPHRLEAGLRQLVRSGLVAQTSGPRGAQYSFRHALMHDAAYRSLLNSARRDLHGRVAGTLISQFPELARREPEVLAHHFTESRAYDEAAGWWQLAGDRDMRRAANREAVAHFSRALEGLQQTPGGTARDVRELEIRRALSTAQIGVEGYTGEALRQNMEQALAISDRLDDPGRLLAPMAGHFAGIYSRGEMAQALHFGAQILRIAGRTHQRGQRMAAHRLLGMAMAGSGDFPGAEAQLLASLALAKPDKDAARLAEEPIERSVSALGYLALVQHLQGNAEQALATDAQAQARAAALRHPGTQVHASTLRACLLVLRGDDAALAETAGQLAEAAGQQGSRPGRVVAETLRELAVAGNNPEPARLAAIAAGRAELRVIGWNVMVAWVSHKEIELCLALGRHAAAREVLEELTAMLEPRGYDMFRAACLLQRAEITRQAGGRGYPGMLREAEAVARAQGAGFWQTQAAAAIGALAPLQLRGDAA